MKKYIPIIIILFVFCISLCLLPFKKGELQSRKYSAENEMAYIVLHNDNSFEFNYSLYSSTIPTGTYKVVGNLLCCYDDSEYKKKYVFKLIDNGLSFDAASSSKLPSFSEIENGTIFQ